MRDRVDISNKAIDLRRLSSMDAEFVKQVRDEAKRQTCEQIADYADATALTPRELAAAIRARKD